MKKLIGTVLLGIASLVLSFIRFPGTILSNCAAIVGGLWLLTRAEWGIVLVGMATLSVGGLVVAGIFFPMLLLISPLIDLSARWDFLKGITFGLIALCCLIISALWGAGVFYGFSHWYSNPTAFWPMLLFAYAVAIEPWVKMAEAKPNDYDLASFLVSYQGACMLRLVVFPFIKLSFLNSVVLMVAGMIFFSLVSSLAVFSAKLCGKDLKKDFSERAGRRQFQVQGGNTVDAADAARFLEK